MNRQKVLDYVGLQLGGLGFILLVTLAVFGEITLTRNFLYGWLIGFAIFGTLKALLGDFK